MLAMVFYLCLVELSGGVVERLASWSLVVDCIAVFGG